MSRSLKLRSEQSAWLGEMGVDLHWLTLRDRRGAVGRAADGQREVAGDVPPAPDATPKQRAGVRAGTEPSPLYLVVAEQPGIDGEKRGLAYPGPQGRLLAAMLQACRLPRRERAYYTTVVSRRLAGGRMPTHDEVMADLPLLRAEIQELKPAWILALGQVAARALLGSTEPLDALRGGPHACALEGGESIPVWVTHPPASLLVRAAFKPQAWRDLAAFATAVQAADRHRAVP